MTIKNNAKRPNAAGQDQVRLERWLIWARTLQAEAQSGLAYAKNPFDIERYERMRDLSVEIMNEYSQAGADRVRKMFAGESGYQTPKVDVRGAVVEDGKILLVQEKLNDGRWSLPGGWADVGLSVKQNIEKEVREEAGLNARATRLVAIYDWLKSIHEAPFSMYKIIMLCETDGGHFAENSETADAAFFTPDALPPLTHKISEEMIAWCLAAAADPCWQPRID
ncbi:NUDIX hydrolase [Pseudoramibacter faecis]|uniref:NUDIX hydrolase n=1 Tax=Pseudoramibacter faecis TaxID=3108534 RepID=UPI002E75AF7B|nr:NUDIX hydrolase [Pseudoramibacter sp. HA2172]